MRIGIDIDDTISDTYEVAFAYAQKYTVNELGKSAQILDLSTPSHFYTREIHNWNEDEEMNFWHKYYKQIITEIRPYTFAVETINQLKKDGHEIIIVTARWPEKNCDVYGMTLEWLDKNKIQYDDIVLNASDKGMIAVEKKIDLFIDDALKNCKDVADAGIKTYLMNTRTNKGLEAKNITRVFSSPDIYDRIKKEENI